MTQVLLNITSPEPSAGILDQLVNQGGQKQCLERWFGGIADGAWQLNSIVENIGAVSAANVFTITSSNMSAADTVTLGITTFTAESSGATGNQFNVGASALITAQNLAAAINAYSTTKNVFSAVATAGAASAGVVTVTVLVPGTTGNMISLSKSSTNGSWTSGHTSAFYGGTDGTLNTIPA